MTEHEAAVIAEWRKIGNQEAAERLERFVVEIDGWSPEEREWASAIMFGDPTAAKPVGILHNTP